MKERELTYFGRRATLRYCNIIKRTVKPNKTNVRKHDSFCEVLGPRLHHGLCHDAHGSSELKSMRHVMQPGPWTMHCPGGQCTVQGAVVAIEFFVHSPPLRTMTRNCLKKEHPMYRRLSVWVMWSFIWNRVACIYYCPRWGIVGLMMPSAWHEDQLNNNKTASLELVMKRAAARFIPSPRFTILTLTFIFKLTKHVKTVRLLIHSGLKCP